MIKHRLIIDTDPGVDDAFAILLAASDPQTEILALTTTAGNVGIENTTRNALGLKQLLGLKCPVFKGADRPLAIPLEDAANVHGEGGLGPYVFDHVPALETTELAWDAIYRLAQANPGSTLVALGPLTNVAIALMRYPDLPDVLGEVISMGGTIGYGNTVPYSEFNYYCDPLAAKIVLESKLKVTMVGLNATRQTQLSPDELASLDPQDPVLNRFVRLQREFYWDRLRTLGMEGFHLPDAAAMAVVLEPVLMHAERLPVHVVTDNGITQGWTVVDLRRRKDEKLHQVNVALSIDKTGYLRLMQQINGLKGGHA